MLLLSYLAATRGHCRIIYIPDFFQSATKINPDTILQIIVDKTMEMVALLFKWILPIIIVSIIIVSNKHKINANGSFETELIGADNAMLKMVWTRYFYQIPSFYYIY